MALSLDGISNKMNDALTTLQAVITVILMLIALRSITANNISSKARNEEEKWTETVKQYGWDPKQLVNKVQHGDVTTFELGTPNYQILNPEAEPEFITPDQPHYKEWLRRLTSTPNASDTIDMSSPSASSSIASRATAIQDSPASINDQEKLQKRSSSVSAEELDAPKRELEPHSAALGKRSIHPKILIYAGARPFQKSIANLS